MKFMKGFDAIMKDFRQNMDDVIAYHKASGLMMTGHHWQFSYHPKKISGHAYDPPIHNKIVHKPCCLNCMMGMMMGPGVYTTEIKLGGMIQKLHDPKVHAAQWAECMKW